MLTSWADILDTPTNEQPTEEWKTIREIAEESGCSEATASRKIHRLVNCQKVEKRVFRVRVGESQTRPVAHYRIVENET